MTEQVYEVHLESFEGPLDLLLYLIRKDDLSITDIPISQITHEYLAYLDLMRELNLEVAGEFLVMAATLMAVKARTLLPSPMEAGEEGPDLHAELVSRLMEYQKFKEAAKYLVGRAEAFKDVFYRGAPRFREDEKVLDINLFDILTALKDVVERAGEARAVISGEEFPIEEKIQKILFLLESHGTVTLSDVFAEERRRLGAIACVLALLELVKLQKVLVRQERLFGPIFIYKKEVANGRPTA